MDKQLTSWELFTKTIKDLSTAQGFYSRLQKQLDEMSPDELERAKELINKEDFKDSIDVILFLEQ